MPDNASYYHAAYAISVVVYAVYALSVWRRRRSLRRRSRDAERGARG
jgi:heme exporter protein D